MVGRGAAADDPAMLPWIAPLFQEAAPRAVESAPKFAVAATSAVDALAGIACFARLDEPAFGRDVAVTPSSAAGGAAVRGFTLGDLGAARIGSQDASKPVETAGTGSQSVRRALPPPFDSPPFPSGEYQGYPLIGIPPRDTTYPLIRIPPSGPSLPLTDCLRGNDTGVGDFMKDNRIKIYGWLNASWN